MIKVSFRALVGVSALIAIACEQPCPSQPSACTPTATLAFALPDGTPEAYEMRVRIRENDVEEEERCLLIAPLPSDWSANTVATCQRNAISLYVRSIADADCDPTVTPTPGGVRVGNSCEVTMSGRELVLTRTGKPDRIDVELVRAGVGFAPLSVTPSYAEQYPDGEHCSARCSVASESRSFDELTQPAQTNAGDG